MNTNRNNNIKTNVKKSYLTIVSNSVAAIEGGSYPAGYTDKQIAGLVKDSSLLTTKEELAGVINGRLILLN